MINLQGITKSFQNGAESIQILHGIDVTLNQGDFASIMGPSGSGKSTLMNIIGCLDKPTTGTYELAGQNISNMSETELSHVRNKEIGFVFQNFMLLPRLTALQNVELPLIYAGVDKKERQERSLAALMKVGLANQATHMPNELSGGQKQRVAVARAIVNNPKFILADEPTGALDTKTSEQIVNLFYELNKQGSTIIMITHDREIGEAATRQIVIRDGNVVQDWRK
ncbi:MULTISPECIES: ABC transporter ATP-binding protein [Bacillus cereus group]|uniref:ABC transporter ATP-binding protein n=1 Tax=Bacillus cereus group TaxID=86661 RepID=UPI00123881E5|nr:ABC transporter ATP-binding protein [Bacillus cereus]KAA6461635.1 ABC transporter ATP-binding protein [Bacillus cereus]KAA6472344.1 ABC transporter ATP-binding protein [Bacillus cereus]KAB2414176.1 ABC transporter ATP-binding protein [Bacillus cereus]KAB2435091.1 ABC transporter ATP-binding protein [Bacillus cereus]KAB2463971.1 ABC transporter ATP-binding protein [Bacillus cereus]